MERGLNFVSLQLERSVNSLSVLVIALLALLLSHLRLAEFSVDNRRADSEIRRLDGAEHCGYSRISARLTGGG